MNDGTPEDFEPQLGIEDTDGASDATPDQAASPDDAAPAADAPKAEGKKPLMVNSMGVIVPRDATDEYRLVSQFMRSGALPMALANVDQALVAYQTLRAFRVDPLIAIRCFAFIRGVPTIWGDLPKAIVMASDMCAGMEEFRFDKDYNMISFDNKNLDAKPFGAVCRAQRADGTKSEAFFTVAMAHTACLMGPNAPAKSKGGCWDKYTSDMLMYRARSRAIKNLFPDVLMGIAIDEYDNEDPYRFKDGGQKKSLSSPRRSLADELNQDHKTIILK